MDSLTAIKVIEDNFTDSEVKEVAFYSLSALTVDDALISALGAGLTEVKGIPPEALLLIKRYDNGLIKNDFWQENYVPIKSQLALADIKLNTYLKYAKFYGDRKDKMALKQMRAILLSRMDVLTTIAFFWKGVEFAEEFDSKFRLAVQLPAEYVDFFTNEGIGV